MIAVAVDDQARDAIRFAPDEAAEPWVDLLALAVFDRLADAAGEKVEIEVLAAARESAGDDLRLRVVDGRAERAVAKIFERDHITGLRITESFADFGGVNPLVAVENAGAGSYDETCHGAGNLRTKSAAVECETIQSTQLVKNSA